MRRALALAALLGGAPAFAAGPPESQGDVVAAVKQAALAIAPPGSSVIVSQADGAAYMPACTAPLGVSITGNAPYQEAA
ncbi:MAG TPA: flagella basal body P-ring formation protein FlgA, partial [Acidocella sp.]|nr:flagella basal body P-ring formation protein FlgA [Acidocella sp.]